MYCCMPRAPKSQIWICIHNVDVFDWIKSQMQGFDWLYRVSQNIQNHLNTPLFEIQRFSVKPKQILTGWLTDTAFLWKVRVSSLAGIYKSFISINFLLHSLHCLKFVNKLDNQNTSCLQIVRFHSSVCCVLYSALIKYYLHIWSDYDVRYEMSKENQ